MAIATSPKPAGAKPAGATPAGASVGTTPYRNAVPPDSRWPDANLFRNPFGEWTRDERATLAVVETRPILDALKRAPPQIGRTPPAHRRAYQLIGDCGRGKTTRLLALHRQLPEASYVYLPEDRPCPAIPHGFPLLIDEAQRLPWRVRRQVLRSGLPLVLATHRDLTRPLRRFGYEVTSEKIGSMLDAGLLAEILNRRLDASRRDPQRPGPRIDKPTAVRLIDRFGTNIRAIESHLYDRVQSQVSQHGQVRFID